MSSHDQEHDHDRRTGQQARGYPRDLSDAKWKGIAPPLPAEVPGRRGRPPAGRYNDT